uniref:Progranulin-like isoform X1 n=1 Tax=Petromyzon marinus TaxID=7757 RepID=A0AAJ7SVF3_PETMA|nr:progranulin-like isoform X1 [Petromyzon marinus]
MALPRPLMFVLVASGLCALVSADRCPDGRFCVSRCCWNLSRYTCCWVGEFPSAEKGEGQGETQGALATVPAQAISATVSQVTSCAGSVCSANGESRCCPLSEGSCCGDGLSCCGKGSTCTTFRGLNLCLPDAEFQDPVATFLSREQQQQQDGCVDSSGCPAGSDCHGASGDHRGQCVSSAALTPWVEKEAALSGPVGAHVVYCGSGQYCRDGQTCCRLATGSWGCCNIPHAICCSDGIHCCPAGHFCLTASGLCARSTLALPAVEGV